MRGFVPTPIEIVDVMVEKLFAGRPPTKSSTLLDPGCGPGAFIDGVLRWSDRQGVPAPRIVGVENEPGRHAEAARHFAGNARVQIVCRDFLLKSTDERFDYVIGNPPYVPITSLSETEKATFRAAYDSARGRFDLYILFFEQALRLLKADGRLIFITPEKFLYVKSAEMLRRILARLNVREIQQVTEETFGDLVTYPTITTVDNAPPRGPARVVLRDGTERAVALPADGASLMPHLNGAEVAPRTGPTLDDVSLRVSCGVATGADSLFVVDTASLPKGLTRFAHPTISGRQLVPGRERYRSTQSLLCPYDANGHLLPFEKLGGLRAYLSEPTRKSKLEGRTCVRHKPWYAFHDSLNLAEILRPKLLLKDITSEPHVWIDRAGQLLPRHTVYYVVPKDPSKLGALADYLNGAEARAWMRAHCQRAANGFLRLQSAVLRHLPVPEHLAAPRSAVRRGKPHESSTHSPSVALAR